MVVLELPKEYAYVIGAGIFSCLTVAGYLGNKVGAARKKAGVPYPYLYADRAEAEKDREKYLFNCVQRGHQNALETHYQILWMLLLGGLKHPIASSIAGVLWSIGRVMYAAGYATGEPKNRQRGGIQYIGVLTLLGTSISTALWLAGVHPYLK